MPKYKIVASDLDGTLLDSNMAVGQINLSAIEKMNKSGVYFVPASGRALCELPDVIKENKDIRYIITSNGAAIIDKDTEKCDCVYLSNEVVKKIYEITSRYKTLSFTHTDGIDYIDNFNSSEEAFYYYGANREYTEVVLSACRTVDNLYEFILKNPTEMLVVFFKLPEERQKCIEELNKISEITVTTSIGSNIEILSSESSKGGALKRLAKLTGISEEEIIAVGDNYNDMSFTETGALCLAVENAVDELKSKADKVICSNNENVADYIFKNFIKNEKIKFF